MNRTAKKSYNPVLNLLRSTATEIVFIASIGGGFWYLLAPPVGASSQAAVGICIAIALALSIAFRSFLSMIAGAGSTIIVLIIALVCLSLALFLQPIYMTQRSQLLVSFKQPGDKTVQVVKGNELLPPVLKNPEFLGMTDEQLLSAAGGPAGRDQVWTAESIRKNELDMVRNFAALLISVLAGTMAILEIFRVRILKIII